VGNARGNDFARWFNALAMTNFFFRTNTMGATEQEDNINFDENTRDAVFKVRALKGRLLG
jgi:hypothetical protein